MQKNMSTLFSLTDYIVAPPEYHRKAIWCSPTCVREKTHMLSACWKLHREKWRNHFTIQFHPFCNSAKRTVSECKIRLIQFDVVPRIVGKLQCQTESWVVEILCMVCLVVHVSKNVRFFFLYDWFEIIIFIRFQSDYG